MKPVTLDDWQRVAKNLEEELVLAGQIVAARDAEIERLKAELKAATEAANRLSGPDLWSVAADPRPNMGPYVVRPHAVGCSLDDNHQGMCVRGTRVSL